MKLLRPLNRVYRGKAYYRWILMIPPKQVRELGWQMGDELETEVRGKTLTAYPASHGGSPPKKKTPRGSAK